MDERPPGGEETRRYWNQRHAGAIWSDQPAEWLREQRQLLEAQPRGRALDIACGGGRNAVFLAELGFEVDALDISDVAIDRVRRLTAAPCLAVTAQRVDLAAAPRFPSASYQVVIDLFYLERSLFAPIVEALSPGGLLFFQTFVGERPAPPATAFGPRFGLEPGELRNAFAALDILHYDEVEIGTEESGRRTVARLAARRPEGGPQPSSVGGRETKFGGFVPPLGTNPPSFSDMPPGRASLERRWDHPVNAGTVTALTRLRVRAARRRFARIAL